MRALVRQMLTNRGILATLALLLALGPFLHGHFGSSHITGFHLDGLDALEHLHTTSPVEQANPFDIESPAVGVAIAVSRSQELRGNRDNDPLPLALFPGLIFFVCLALAGTPALRRARCSSTPPARRHSRPGAPPPALAPPALN